MYACVHNLKEEIVYACVYNLRMGIVSAPQRQLSKDYSTKRIIAFLYMESLESKGIINYKLNCPRALT